MDDTDLRVALFEVYEDQVYKFNDDFSDFVTDYTITENLGDGHFRGQSSGDIIDIRIKENLALITGVDGLISIIFLNLPYGEIVYNRGRLQYQCDDSSDESNKSDRYDVKPAVAVVKFGDNDVHKITRNDHKMTYLKLLATYTSLVKQYISIIDDKAAIGLVNRFDEPSLAFADFYKINDTCIAILNNQVIYADDMRCIVLPKKIIITPGWNRRLRFQLNIKDYANAYIEPVDNVSTATYVTYNIDANIVDTLFGIRRSAKTSIKKPYQLLSYFGIYCTPTICIVQDMNGSV